MPIPVREKNRPHPESGALLLIVAAALILIGTLVSYGIGALRTENDVDRTYEARQELEFIIDQLAAYVHRNNKLPAPDGASGVPVRELNISERYRLDPWGNALVYAVSPIFQDPPHAGLTKIFFRCRTEEWINDTTNDDENENPDKAYFCCPAPEQINKDIQIDTDGDSHTEDLKRYQGNVHNIYDTIDQPEQTITNESNPNNILSPSQYSSINIEAYAVVLISHGPDGTGIEAGPPQNTSFKRKNDDDDDDIMIWRTQLSLYSELGNASCFSPWE